MDEKNITTVEKESTPRQKRTVQKQSKSIDDLKLSERVSIDNLSDWDVSFVSEDTGKDILIAGNVKNFKKLTLAEVDNQVKVGNIAFCGTDDLGSHAIFRINDPLVREYVFGEDVNPIQLTQDAIKSLLEISDKRKFNDVLSELVVTNSEKRMIVRMCEKIGVDDVASFKIAAIEKISGIKFE